MLSDPKSILTVSVKDKSTEPMELETKIASRAVMQSSNKLNFWLRCIVSNYSAKEVLEKNRLKY